MATSLTGLAWAAGFFEGEGSVRVSRPAARNWGTLNVDVPNTDESVVRFFEQRWGGSVKHQPQGGRRRAVWRWRLAARQAVPFLEAIRPYLVSVKYRDRVDHALAFQAQKIATRANRSEAYRQAQWEAYWWMAELNVRGVRT